MARAGAPPRGLLLGAAALSALAMAPPALAGAVARTTVGRAQPEACPDQCIIWPFTGGSAVDLSHLDDLTVNLTLPPSHSMEWSFNWCRPRPSKICPAHGATRGFVFTKDNGAKCSTDNWFFQQLSEAAMPSDDRITLRYNDATHPSGRMVDVNLYCDQSLPMHVAQPVDGEVNSNWPASPEILTVDFKAKIACKPPPTPVAPVPMAPRPPSPSDCRFYPQNGGNQIDLSVLKNWGRVLTQGGNNILAFWEINWCVPKVSAKCKSVWGSQPGFIFQSGKDGYCTAGDWIFQKLLQAEGGNGDPILLTFEDTYHPDGGKKNGTFTISIDCDEGAPLDTINSATMHLEDNWPSQPERLTMQARGKIACKNAFA